MVGLRTRCHTLLYRCPRCGEEFQMHGEGETIRCTACGNGACVNPDYSLSPLDNSCVLPSSPKRWFDEERKIVYREILDPAFSALRTGTPRHAAEI